MAKKQQDYTRKKEFTVTEFAYYLKVSRQAVLKQIKTGKITAKKVGNQFIIYVK